MKTTEEKIQDLANEISTLSSKLYRTGYDEAYAIATQEYGDVIVDAFIDAGLIGFDIENGVMVHSPEVGELSIKIIDVLKNTDKRIWKALDEKGGLYG